MEITVENLIKAITKANNDLLETEGVSILYFMQLNGDCESDDKKLIEHVIERENAPQIVKR